jgi:hypothetical protein
MEGFIWQPGRYNTFSGRAGGESVNDLGTVKRK